MFIGIGTDIVEIKRIKEAIERTSRFVEKLFTEQEKEFFLKKGSPMEHAAGAFAAKEAVSKALGTGFRHFEMRDIEIIRDTKGKPEVVLYNGAKEWFEQIGGVSILVSISHCKEYAVAMVTIEGSDKGEGSL